MNISKFEYKGKPTLKTRQYLDYYECLNYIETKYGFKASDFENFYKGPLETEWQDAYSMGRPHLDFWHYIIDNYGHLHNECFFHMKLTSDVSTPKWVAQILSYWYQEFGEHANEKDELDLFVKWTT